MPYGSDSGGHPFNSSIWPSWSTKEQEKKVSYRLACGWIFWRHFLEFPSSQMTTCQADITLASTLPWSWSPGQLWAVSTGIGNKTQLLRKSRVISSVPVSLVLKQTKTKTSVLKDKQSYPTWSVLTSQDGNLSILKAEQRGHKFETSLGYIERFCLKKIKMYKIKESIPGTESSIEAERGCKMVTGA